MRILRAPNKIRATAYSFVGAAGGLLLYEATHSSVPLLNGIVGGSLLCFGLYKTMKHLMKPRIILDAKIEEIADNAILSYKQKCERCGEKHEYKQLVYHDDALAIEGLDAIVESSEKINDSTIQLTLKDMNSKKTIECYALNDYFCKDEQVKVNGSLRRGEFKNYIVADKVIFGSAKTF